MPALSPTMTEGTLARWLKKEGETVKAGDVIAEIETDKATMEGEAGDEGGLGRIFVHDGPEGVKVNEPIAVLVDAGEKVPDATPAAKAPAAAPATADAAPTQAAKPAPANIEATAASASGASTAAPSAAASVTPAQANGHAQGERVFASPLARRMAAQAGIALAALKGSGP